MKKLIILPLLSCLPLLPGTFAAAAEQQNLICAVVDIMECMPASDCLRSDAESVNLPQFIKLDFKGKMLTAVRPDKAERQTKVEALEAVEGRTILHGQEGGRGWSIVVNHQTGKMSASVSEDDYGFVIFGACTTL